VRPDPVANAMVVAIPTAEAAVALWVLVRRRGILPVLIVNLLLAVAVLLFALSYLPDEIADIRAGDATELFDYKSSILTVFETVTLIASGLAFRRGLTAKTLAWVGFAGNFALSVLVVLFALTFEFKCCGYL
jgi:hypothetical protein